MILLVVDDSFRMNSAVHPFKTREEAIEWTHATFKDVSVRVNPDFFSDPLYRLFWIEYCNPSADMWLYTNKTVFRPRKKWHVERGREDKGYHRYLYRFTYIGDGVVPVPLDKWAGYDCHHL